THVREQAGKPERKGEQELFCETHHRGTPAARRAVPQSPLPPLSRQAPATQNLDHPSGSSEPDPEQGARCAGQTWRRHGGPFAPPHGRTAIRKRWVALPTVSATTPRTFSCPQLRRVSSSRRTGRWRVTLTTTSAFPAASGTPRSTPLVSSRRSQAGPRT